MFKFSKGNNGGSELNFKSLTTTEDKFLPNPPFFLLLKFLENISFAANKHLFTK